MEHRKPSMRAPRSDGVVSRARLLGRALSVVALLACQPVPAVRAQDLFGPDVLFDPLTRVPNALVGKKAPELRGDSGWLNSEPLRLADLAGRVVLIDFFDYSCINCIRTFPYLREWHRRYGGLGLTVIGVHTPEFAFGRDEKNVARALAAHGITYPVAMDANQLIWNEYHNRYWPREFLIDIHGVVRLDHRGEGGYAETEKKIQELLRVRDPDVTLPPLMSAVREGDRVGAVCFPTTGETYVGHLRGMLANPEGYKPNGVVVYQDPGGALDGRIYAQGAWESRGQYLRLAHAGAAGEDYLRLPYHALELNVVLESIDGPPIEVVVWQDGKPLHREDAGEDVTFDEQGRSVVRVTEPRMYRIVRNRKFARRQILLSSATPTLGVYVFTFGSCVDPSGGHGKGKRPARAPDRPSPTQIGGGSSVRRADNQAGPLTERSPTEAAPPTDPQEPSGGEPPAAAAAGARDSAACNTGRVAVT